MPFCCEARGHIFLIEYKLHALKSVSKIKQHALKGQKLLAQGVWGLLAKLE